MVDESQLFLILLLLGFYDGGGREHEVIQQSRNARGNADTLPTVHI